MRMKASYFVVLYLCLTSMGYVPYGKHSSLITHGIEYKELCSTHPQPCLKNLPGRFGSWLSVLCGYQTFLGCKHRTPDFFGASTRELHGKRICWITIWFFFFVYIVGASSLVVLLSFIWNGSGCDDYILASVMDENIEELGVWVLLLDRHHFPMEEWQ